jgi:hypothetical protein
MLFKYQLPALLPVKEVIPLKLFFWPSLVILNLIIAPLHFWELLSNSKNIKPNLEQKIKELTQDRKI